MGTVPSSIPVAVVRKPASVSVGKFQRGPLSGLFPLKFFYNPQDHFLTGWCFAALVGLGE